MKLTREKALKLHRQMWKDMQKELGDNPKPVDRVIFKLEWCGKYFSNEIIRSGCFLCEYACGGDYDSYCDCDKCPVIWGTEDHMVSRYCSNVKTGYKCAPISVILALQEK